MSNNSIILHSNKICNVQSMVYLSSKLRFYRVIQKIELKKLSSALIVLSMMMILLMTLISMTANAATTIKVTNEAELRNALDRGETNIVITSTVTNTIVLESSLTIDSGVTVTLQRNFDYGRQFYTSSLTVQGTFNIGEGVLFETGDVSVNGGVINNYGDIYMHTRPFTINNRGVLNNYATFLNFNGGTLNNVGGTINNNALGSINCCSDGSTINNKDGGIINNRGKIDLWTGGTINNYADGTINNYVDGVFHYGKWLLTQDDGIFNNEGTFNDDLDEVSVSSLSDTSRFNFLNGDISLGGSMVLLVVVVSGVVLVVVGVCVLLLRKRKNEYTDCIHHNS